MILIRKSLLDIKPIIWGLRATQQPYSRHITPVKKAPGKLRVLHSQKLPYLWNTRCRWICPLASRRAQGTAGGKHHSTVPHTATTPLASHRSVGKKHKKWAVFFPVASQTAAAPRLAGTAGRDPLGKTATFSLLPFNSDSLCITTVITMDSLISYIG